MSQQTAVRYDPTNGIYHIKVQGSSGISVEITLSHHILDEARQQVIRSAYINDGVVTLARAAKNK